MSLVVHGGWTSPVEKEILAFAMSSDSLSIGQKKGANFDPWK
jgi:hypothetical protein